MKIEMRMIAPRTGHPAAHEVTVAEEQLEYLPITVERYTHDNGSVTILTRWTPSAEQRAAIAAGSDVYVTQLNFGAPMTPMAVYCGASPWGDGSG